MVTAPFLAPGPTPGLVITDFQGAIGAGFHFSAGDADGVGNHFLTFGTGFGPWHTIPRYAVRQEPRNMKIRGR